MYHIASIWHSCQRSLKRHPSEVIDHHQPSYVSCLKIILIIPYSFVFPCSRETWDGIPCVTLKSRVSSADGFGGPVVLFLCHHSLHLACICHSFRRSLRTHPGEVIDHQQPSYVLCLKVLLMIFFFCFTAQGKTGNCLPCFMLRQGCLRLMAFAAMWTWFSATAQNVPHQKHVTFLSKKRENTPF